LQAVPFLYESAKTGMRVRKVLDLILEVAASREVRAKTAEVNQVLSDLVNRNQPPQKPGKEVKLLYASQIATKPPTFAVVSNRPDAVTESYRRYIQHGFRAAFGFKGTPIRLRFRRKRGR
jgi:GTP-binding protein